MGEQECRRFLKLALDADESGDKESAIEYYTNAVEEIIKLGPCEAREKLNTFAKRALDRAEELKGIKFEPPPISPISPSRTAFVQSSSTEVLPSSSAQNLKLGLEVSGKQTYSPEERRVLEHTSRINNIIFVPFMAVDLKEKFIYPMPYTDKEGLLQLSPKQKRDLDSWVRVSELSADPKMVYGSHVDFYSIKQTVVSDCSFVASLAVASLYEKQFGKRLISSIIYPRNSKDEPIYNPSGKYSIRLHVNGIPRKVVIDDYLPVGKYNQLLCSYSSNKNEYWVSLLEKAYMKLMGGYDFPGSNSNIDLHALTGWIPERVSIRPNEPDFNADAVFERLREGQSAGRCLITVATGDLSDADAERTGLVSTHAYAVLGLREINGVKLLQLKNPWSHLRWRGNYSELDTVHWTTELQQELNYDPSMAAQIDNGVFWIDYNSVLHFFDVFYLNWNPKLFQFTYCIHESWNAGVGPTKDAYTIGDNPQYSLSVPAGRGSVWILLTRHITSIEDFRENREYITLLVYNQSGKRVYYPYEPKPYIDGVRINSPHYLCKIRLDPNTPRIYTLVVSQYEKSTTIYYTLRAFSRQRFNLNKINDVYHTKEDFSGEWTSQSAGGCQNHPSTYKTNPMYRLTIGPRDTCNLVIELRAPKVYQVGIELVNLSLEDPTVTAPFKSQTTGNYRSGFCFLDLDDIPAGVYTVMVSTFDPQQLGPFFLKVKCTTGVTIEKIQ